MAVYILPIKYALIIFPFLAALITLPFMIKQYFTYGSIHKLRVLIVYSFTLYLLTSYFLVILPLPEIESVKNLDIAPYQIELFASVKTLISSVNWQNFNLIKFVQNPVFYTTLYNILLTIPFGIYLHYYFKKGFIKTTFYTFLLSLFFEITQLTGLYFIYPSNYRLFDVDDLFFNTLGGCIGYLVSIFLLKFLPTRDQIDNESYILGQEISTIRRLLAFFIDAFIFLIVTAIFIITIYQYNINVPIITILIIIITIYYLIIPTIFKGYTLGKRLVNIRIVTVKSNKNARLKILTRNAILYLLYLPAIYYLWLLNNYFILSNYIFFTILLIIIIMYILSFISLLTHDRLIYEKLTDTQLKSQINYLPNNLDYDRINAETEEIEWMRGKNFQLS